MIDSSIDCRVYLKKFFALTSRTSHLRSIPSPVDASFDLRGRFPLTTSFPLLLTLLSNELMHNLFDLTCKVPPKFVRGLRSTGEEIDALWNEADPSSTGCSTVPLTCSAGKVCVNELSQGLLQCLRTWTEQLNFLMM